MLIIDWSMFRISSLVYMTISTTCLLAILTSLLASTRFLWTAAFHIHVSVDPCVGVSFPVKSENVAGNLELFVITRSPPTKFVCANFSKRPMLMSLAPHGEWFHFKIPPVFWSSSLIFKPCFPLLFDVTIKIYKYFLVFSHSHDGCRSRTEKLK